MSTTTLTIKFGLRSATSTTRGSRTYPVPLWTSGTSFPTIQTNFNGPGVSMVARLTTTASPTLLNEFVASYTTDHITTSLIGPWQRPSGMLPIGIYDNGFGGRVPGISLAGGNYGDIAEDPGYVPNGPLNSNPTYTYRDNVTKISFKHNLQFGGYFVSRPEERTSSTRHRDQWLSVV